MCRNQFSDGPSQLQESKYQDNLTKEQNDWIEEIIKIENDSGEYIAPNNDLEVLNFLSGWAKICIAKNYKSIILIINRLLRFEYS